MWEIYDEMITAIPDDIPVDEYFSGSKLSYVKANGSIGICETITGGIDKSHGGHPATLRQAAELSKSWNYTEASLGVAALNCWYNSTMHLHELNLSPQKSVRAFARAAKNLADGKNIALFNHCQCMEKIIKPVSSVSVICREITKMGDYPSAAVHYILPDMDMVLADSQAIVRKRIHILTANSNKFVLFGPGIPLCRNLLSHGVNEIMTYSVPDEVQDECRSIAMSGAGIETLMAKMQFVRFSRECEQ